MRILQSMSEAKHKKIATRPKSGPSDVELGRRLFLARELQGLTQSNVGRVIGVSFQQIQKYERGTNRVAARRLPAFKKLYGQSYNFFLDDLDQKKPSATVVPGFEDAGLGFAEQMKEYVSKYKPLISLYEDLPDKKSQKFILDMMKNMRRLKEEC